MCASINIAPTSPSPATGHPAITPKATNQPATILKGGRRQGRSLQIRRPRLRGARACCKTPFQDLSDSVREFKASSSLAPSAGGMAFYLKIVQNRIKNRFQNSLDF